MTRLEARLAALHETIGVEKAELIRAFARAEPWAVVYKPEAMAQAEFEHLAQIAREIAAQCEAEDRAEREATEPMTKAKLLDTARAAVADRGLNYGRPEDNFRRIAHLWNAHLDNRKPGELSSSDVAVMMVLMKAARLENTPDHMDSWIDIAGYAACGGEIAGAASV